MTKATSVNFKLDFSKVPGLVERSAELEGSIAREYSGLSITPRTFKGRDYINIDALTISNASRDALKSLKVSLETILSDSPADIETLATQLTSIGLLTIGKSKQIIGKFKKNVESAKALLIDASQKEFVKLEEGVKKFESSIDVASIATIDHYVNPEGKEVLKYGMNITPEIVEDINSFNSTVATRITAIAASSVSSSSTGRSKKSSNSAKSKGIEDTNNFIHLVELCLMTEALKSLTTYKPVLVETFARNAEGEIVFDDKKQMLDSDENELAKMPEVHTVLLYKMSGENNNQVLIIDPSNSNYTKHFVLGHNKGLIEHITREERIGGEGGISLVAPFKKVQIYKHPDEVSVGPAANQARDCIDIAVKLAFEIMVHADQPLQDVALLQEWDPVIRISNFDGIDSTILVESMANRIKQSSDDELRNKYFKVNKKIAELKLIISGNEFLQEGLLEKYKEVLASVENDENRSYKDLLSSTIGYDNLKSVYDEVCASLNQITEEGLEEISAMLIGINEEIEE